MFKKEQPDPDPYTEIGTPDKEDAYEIDSSGKKQPKLTPEELRLVEEQPELLKLKKKDPERYQEVRSKAKDNARERSEKETVHLPIKDRAEALSRLIKEEERKLALKWLEYLEKIGK